MRFSDLKNFKQEALAPEPGRPVRAAPAPEKARAVRPEAKPPAPQPSLLPPVPEAAKPAPPQRSRRETRALSRIPEAPFDELDAWAGEVYSRTLSQAAAFLAGVDRVYTEQYEAVLASCGLIIETLKTNGVLLHYTSYSTSGDYLRAHTANTAILALAMGLEAGLDASELNLLGFCAMAHDIGMTEYSSLYNRPDRLGKDEFAEMSLHAEAGVAKLDRIVDLDYKIKERARRIVLQVHERDDGTGYPDRLSNEELDPLAQLIGTADTYEAMTHPRPWRDAMNPAEAIKELVETEGRGLNSRAVKALISALSIYPPGTFVALSSGDMARVLRVTRGFLTKPLVEILLDQEFSPVEPQLLDLFEHPLISIDRAVDFRELQAANPEFSARLEAARWWQGD